MQGKGTLHVLSARKAQTFVRWLSAKMERGYYYEDADRTAKAMPSELQTIWPSDGPKTTPWRDLDRR